MSDIFLPVSNGWKKAVYGGVEKRCRSFHFPLRRNAPCAVPCLSALAVRAAANAVALLCIVGAGVQKTATFLRTVVPYTLMFIMYMPGARLPLRYGRAASVLSTAVPAVSYMRMCASLPVVPLTMMFAPSVVALICMSLPAVTLCMLVG